MLLTVGFSSAVHFELAIFAAQILFFRVFFEVKLLLTVDHATKVGLLAIEAFVERAGMHCQTEEVSFVGITGSDQSLALVQSLILGYLEGEPLNGLTKLLQVLDLS